MCVARINSFRQMCKNIIFGGTQKIFFYFKSKLLPNFLFSTKKREKTDLFNKKIFYPKEINDEKKKSGNLIIYLLPIKKIKNKEEKIKIISNYKHVYVSLEKRDLN